MRRISLRADNPTRRILLNFFGPSGTIAHGPAYGPMNRIEAYRDYAWECLALAKSLTSERERRALIEMAAVWHELAEARSRFVDEHDGQEPEFGWRDQPDEEGPSH